MKYFPFGVVLVMVLLLSACAEPDTTLVTVQPETSAAFFGSGHSPPDERLATASQQNPDTVAWLTVPGTNIDGPVVQAADNEYYLRRDALAQPAFTGCYYADYECDFAQLSTNTIIYGHTFTEDGEDPDVGFGQLRFFEDPDFAKEHPVIILSVAQQKMEFEVISVGYANTDQEQVCILAQPTSSEFKDLLHFTAMRNILGPLPILSEADKLLTLSTCTEQKNKRLLIVGRLRP